MAVQIGGRLNRKAGDTIQLPTTIVQSRYLGKQIDDGSFQNKNDADQHREWCDQRRHVITLSWRYRAVAETAAGFTVIPGFCCCRTINQYNTGFAI